MKKIIAICSAIVLTACGGGGGGDNGPDLSPGGVYTGTFYSNVVGESFPVKGVVSETGKFYFIDTENGPLYQGAGNTDGDEYDGFFRGFAPSDFEFVNGKTWTEGPIKGMVDERGTFSGTYSAAGGDNGSFTLTYVPAEYEIASSLTLLNGNWRAVKDGVTTNITIAIDGTYTGSDSRGCTYTGAISVVNPSYNAYHVILNQTCGRNFAGMGGVATYGPAVGGGKPTITAGIGGVTTGIYAVFTKL